MLARHLALIALAVAPVAGAVALTTSRLHAQAADWAAAQRREPEIIFDGDVTRGRFVTIIDATPARVEGLLWDTERLQHMVPAIQTSKLIEADDNRKQMQIALQVAEGLIVEWQVNFEIDRDARRITFMRRDPSSPQFSGEYQLRASPDGSRTRLEYRMAVGGQQAIEDASRSTGAQQRFSHLVEALQAMTAAG